MSNFYTNLPDYIVESLPTLSLVPGHQIFHVHPAALSKNGVWTLSLQKLGHVYMWRSVNGVTVGLNYIISFLHRLICFAVKEFASWLFAMTHNAIYFT